MASSSVIWIRLDIASMSEVTTIALSRSLMSVVNKSLIKLGPVIRAFRYLPLNTAAESKTINRNNHVSVIEVDLSVSDLNGNDYL